MFRRNATFVHEHCSKRFLTGSITAFAGGNSGVFCLRAHHEIIEKTLVFFSPPTMDKSNPIDTMAPPAEHPARKRKRGSCRRRFTRGKKQKASEHSNQRQLHKETESSNGLVGVIDNSDTSKTQPHRELHERQPSDPPIDNNFMTTAPIEVIEEATQPHLLKGKLFMLLWLPTLNSLCYVLRKRIGSWRGSDWHRPDNISPSQQQGELPTNPPGTANNRQDSSHPQVSNTLDGSDILQSSCPIR